MNNRPANITPFPVARSPFPVSLLSKTPSDRRAALNTFACRRRRSGCPTSEARSFCEAKVARGRATDIANRCF